MFDELILDDNATGVAVLTDPQRKRFPECPCGSCGKKVGGAMPGWYLRKGPAPVLDAHLRQKLAAIEGIHPDEVSHSGAHRHLLRPWTFLEHGDHGDLKFLLLPKWVDHPYRLRLADGRWCYMCEPYELLPDALDDFAALDAAGYDVKVTAYRARHLRGRSLAIEIVEREKEVPHVLYRFFDKAGRLLYVGLTMNPGARWKGHSKDKPWWTDVATSAFEKFPNRKSVEAAERKAIETERPLHNIVHNRGQRKASPTVGSREEAPASVHTVGDQRPWYELCRLSFIQRELAQVSPVIHGKAQRETLRAQKERARQVYSVTYREAGRWTSYTNVEYPNIDTDAWPAFPKAQREKAQALHRRLKELGYVNGGGFGDITMAWGFRTATEAQVYAAVAIQLAQRCDDAYRAAMEALDEEA